MREKEERPIRARERNDHRFKMSNRERKIDATNVSLINVFPQLSTLDAFKDKRPYAIDRQKLTSMISSLR